MRPLLASALILIVTGAARSDGSLAVRQASIRFGAEGRGNLRIEGDLTLAGDLAGPGPAASGFRLDLGSTTVVDGIPEEARVRVRPNGDWRVTARGPDGGRLNLSVVPASGVFTLRARNWQLPGLLNGGPADVPCSVTAGETTGADSLDFEVRGRRWEYRRPPSKGPGPGPGDGGGGGGGVTNFTTIAQGQFSGIFGFRFEVVTDASAWQALWAAHAGTTAPSVDFANEMVVGIWLGERPSSGYIATITAIVPATVLGVPCFGEVCPPSGRMVTVIEDQPCGGLDVLTHPYHIVRVPKETWGGALVEVVTRAASCF